jgi:hypothetical protein
MKQQQRPLSNLFHLDAMFFFIFVKLFKVTEWW